MGVASVLTGGMGIYQAISGAKEKRNAQNALENYQRQNLQDSNVAKDLQVSTLGADRQLAEQSRLASTQIGALQGGGTRALIGGLGRVEAGNQAVNDRITADLDQQQKQIDQMVASDNANIRGMQENRENADINALSSQYQSGKNDMNMGIGNVIQGVGSVANQFGSPTADTEARTPVESLSGSITPYGVKTSNNIYAQDPQFMQNGVGMFKRRNPYVNQQY